MKMNDDPFVKHNPRHSTAFVSSFRSSAKKFTNRASIIAPSKSSPYQSPPHQEHTASPVLSQDRSSSSSGSSRPTTQRTASTSVSTNSSSLSPSDGSPRQPSLKVRDAYVRPIGRRKPLPRFHNIDAPLKPNFISSFDPDAAAKHLMAGSATMTVTQFTPAKHQTDHGKPPSSAHSTVGFGQGGGNGHIPTPAVPAYLPPAGGHNPMMAFQNIQEMSSKRINTLNYLRKAHAGRVYWFNTLLFSRSDLAKLPFFEAKRLARRATNYLLLGLSLPVALDMNTNNPLEYLKSLNGVLADFESYQQVHPPEGNASSSLSRARIPHMFKRAAHTSSKGRRTSSATDIGMPISTSDPADLKSMASHPTTASSSVASSFPSSEQDLLPGEEYTHLVTPALPFEPDFFETFTTLCDVLIDCYTTIVKLVPSSAQCVPGVGETFIKADGKVRKLLVNGIVKEFEEASRQGAKAEMAGLGKVVLSGMM